MSRDITDEEFYQRFERLYRDLTTSGKAPWMVEHQIEREGAYNPKSGVIFKGVNSLILEMSAADKNFKDPRWLSESEINERGLHVRLNEKPTPIAYINKYVHHLDKHPSTGRDFEPNTPKQKYYWMYNISQLKEHEQLKGMSLTVSEEIIREKRRNAIANARTNNFQAINQHLGEKTAEKAPAKTEPVAAAIAQYRLAQEFNIKYRPSFTPESLREASAGIKTDTLLRALYHSEVEKDRLISRNRTLETGINRTVTRDRQKETVLER